MPTRGRPDERRSARACAPGAPTPRAGDDGWGGARGGGELVAAGHEVDAGRLVLQPRGDDGDLVGEMAGERAEERGIVATGLGGTVERERWLRPLPRADEQAAIELDTAAAGDL